MAEFAIRHPDGTLTDYELWAELLEPDELPDRSKVRTAGGKGSGNFGHAGRPGEVGGSAEGWTAGGRALRPEEAQTVVDYATFSMQLNSDLREGKPVEAKFRDTMQHLDSAIRSSVADTRTALYRSGPRRIYGALKRGDVLIDKGYLSTSKNRQAAEELLGIADEDDMLIEISVPPDTYGLDVNRGLGDRSPFPTQDEVILPRETAFKVVSTTGGTLKIRVLTPSEKRKLQ